MIQSPEFVGGESTEKLCHHQHCSHEPCGRVVVMTRLPDVFDMGVSTTEFVNDIVLDNLPGHGAVETLLKRIAFYRCLAGLAQLT